MTDGYAMALVGAQYGSEGKGVIAAALAHSFRGAIRVGGPNAGHSLYKDGELFKMRSIPCAWVNGNAVLMIGAGAVVNPVVLEDEFDDIFNRWSGSDRPMPIVVVDPQAVLVTPDMEHAEAETIRGLIGSTAEGVGEARISKVQRRGGAILARDYSWSSPYIEIGDVASLAADLIEVGGRIMLEGTQGSGLSLHHGHYPYVTSTDTNASGIAAEAGIAPSKVKCTHLVIRSYPIRVAGNSGPMGGRELDWNTLTEQFQIAAPEQTTVTRKTRRIAEYNEAEVDRAVLLNNPCGLWLTFADYLDPSIRGDRGLGHDATGKSGPVQDFARYLSGRYQVPILGISTGLGSWDDGQPDWMVWQYNEYGYRPRCIHGELYEVSKP